MKDAFVVDASVGFSWVYPGQASEKTDELLERIKSGAKVVVPSLWFLEVANGLLAAERRRLLKRAERERALAMLSELPLISDEDASRVAFGRTSVLASEHALSVYDAAYVETATRHKLPLGSRDLALRKAAGKCGIRLLG